MPYTVAKSTQCPVSKPWAVKNVATGAIVPGGCHTTKAQAIAHLAALQSNVPDASATNEEPWRL